jgi:protoheme IX farnesyltransferase
MAELLLHRLPNKKAHNLAEKSEFDGVLYGADLQDKEQKRQDREPSPVAYASVAPFPFLPVPIYEALFSLRKFLVLATVALSFVFNIYCSITD